MDTQITQSKITKRKPTGFAALPQAERRAISSRGGKVCHAQGKAHEFTSVEAVIAGQKGGRITAQKPGHMSKIGRVGGLKASRGRQHMANIGRKGGRRGAAKKEAT